MPFNAGQKVRPSQLGTGGGLPQGEVYRTRRASASTATTTTVQGVLRIDNMALIAGRAYEVMTSGLVCSSTVSGDWVAAQLRYDTTGAAATGTSTQLPGGTLRGQAVTSSGNIGPASTVLRPATNMTVSIILCVVRSSGTGSVSLFADAANEMMLYVKDIAQAAADTGVII